jgi:hypothetical protein
MTKFLETIFGGAFVLLVILGIAIVMAVPTYYLWNWLMPNIPTTRNNTRSSTWTEYAQFNTVQIFINKQR